MNTITNLDLLWVGIAVAGAGTLGSSIYFSDRKNASSRVFFVFTLVSILWGLANFASARTTDPLILLWSIRLVIFFATWFVFSLLILSIQFPDPVFKIKNKIFYCLLGWTSLISALTLTPAVYEAVTLVSPVVRTKTGIGLCLFAPTIIFYIGASIWNVTRKFIRARGEQHDQFRFVLLGLSTTFIFLVVFEFVFPALLNNPTFIPYGGLFLLPFILGTAYAILRYRLFNLRVAIFGLLVFVLATATFFDVLLSDSLSQILYRSAELVMVLFAGVLLIKSMVREFELKKKLEQSNEQLSEFMSLATHEIRNPATFIKGYTAGALEGDLGELTPAIKDGMQKLYVRANDIIHLGNQYLNKSKLELNQIKYEWVPTDMKKLIEDLAHEFEPTAAQQGLHLSTDIDLKGEYTIAADTGKLKEVISNLIDNSIKYTPRGEVTISLARVGEKIRVIIKDTGVGIPADVIPKLFQKFSRADAAKANILGTGLGLYLAKIFVDAHHGTIAVTSTGKDRGSTFTLELPVNKAPSSPSA